MVFAMHWHESAMDLQYLLFAIILQPLPVDLSQFGAPSPFFSLLFKFPIFYKIEHLFSSSQKPSRNISVPSKFVLFLAPAENPDKLLFESEKWKLLSCVRIFVTHGIYSPWNTPSQNTGVGSCSILQRIFPTQVSRIAGRFFISWATREAQSSLYSFLILLHIYFCIIIIRLFKTQATSYNFCFLFH